MNVFWNLLVLLACAAPFLIVLLLAHLLGDDRKLDSESDDPLASVKARIERRDKWNGSGW